MKKWIKASSKSTEVIFEDEYFTFVRRWGVGMKGIHYEELYVKSKGLADEHVVQVRLNSTNFMEDPGEGEVFKYEYKDAYVAHGMRPVTDTLQDTRDYIAVLQDAVEFAERIDEWLETNQ